MTKPTRPTVQRRIALRLEFDHMSRDEADLLATRTLAALTATIGLAADTLPRLYPKRRGEQGWLVYVNGDIDVPENLNP